MLNWTTVSKYIYLSAIISLFSGFILHAEVVSGSELQYEIIAPTAEPCSISAS